MGFAYIRQALTIYTTFMINTKFSAYINIPTYIAMFDKIGVYERRLEYFESMLYKNQSIHVSLARL